MAKGSSFENEVCKALSMWWTEGTRDDAFRRSQNSGGRYTTRKKSGKETLLQSGDITCKDSDGELLSKEWSIECKTGYSPRNKKKKSVLVDGKEEQKTSISIVNWCPSDVLDGSAAQTVFIRLWEQAWRDGELSNRKSVLIFRRPMRKPCIVITRQYFKYLTVYFGFPDAPYIEYHEGMHNLVAMGLKSFFSWIPNIRPSISKRV
jgi:hypothetical protein